MRIFLNSKQSNLQNILKYDSGDTVSPIRRLRKQKFQIMMLYLKIFKLKLQKVAAHIKVKKKLRIYHEIGSRVQN